MKSVILTFWVFAGLVCGIALGIYNPPVAVRSSPPLGYLSISPNGPVKPQPPLIDRQKHSSIIFVTGLTGAAVGLAIGHIILKASNIKHD